MAVQHLRLIACPFARLECVASRSKLIVGMSLGAVLWGIGITLAVVFGGRCGSSYVNTKRVNPRLDKVQIIVAISQTYLCGVAIDWLTGKGYHLGPKHHPLLVRRRTSDPSAFMI
jgi:hypothetical protein